MNRHVELRDGVLVCGVLHEAQGCVCLREEGHWGPHVVLEPDVGYFLVQTSCMPITFPLPEVVALQAIEDKSWAYPD